MFEQEISFNISQVNSEFDSNKNSISLKEILQNDNIENRFKKFFENEVKYWLYQESIENFTNKRYDFTNPEVASLMDYLDKLKLRYCNFNREEFDKILDTSVKITFNYLCRPQTTLKWFIFRGEPIKPIDEVILRLEPFADYNYFQEVFLEWVERERKEKPAFENISSQEFERILRKTDDQILVDCSADQLLDIMKPLFEFVGKTKRQIPLTSVIIFFDDKNIQKLVIPLEEMYNHGKETITRSELIDEIIKVIENNTEPQADFTEVFSNIKLNDVIKTHIVTNSLNIDEDNFNKVVDNKLELINDIDKDSIPLNDSSTINPNNEIVNDNKVNIDIEKKQSDLLDNLLLNEIDEEKTDKNKFPLEINNSYNDTSQRDKDDISQILKNSKKNLVIKELDESISKKTLAMIFKNHENEYNIFINKLKDSDTLDEALTKIDLICLKQGIDPNSFIPLRLGKAIYSWFK